jgi:alpha-D-ribose 1-methylphosphonate 5-triphosphate synthase subunit PhnH
MTWNYLLLLKKAFQTISEATAALLLLLKNNDRNGWLSHRLLVKSSITHKKTLHCTIAFPATS